MTSSSASSIRIGSYHLGARIGEGGAGEVYRAEGPDGVVVIELLGPERVAGDVARARLGREVDARARVQHPSLVRVLDHGVDDEHGRYLVTPLLAGRTLRAAFDGRRCGAEAAILVAAPIAAAVAALHAAGLRHGALEPAHVIVTPAGEVVVIGLGLAGREGGPRSPDDDPAVGYLAPEQLDGRQVGPAADAWAIGVMLYEWVAGRRPFARAQPSEEEAAALLGSFAPLATAERRAGEALSTLVASCLAVDPAARPSMAALAAQLDALIDGLPADPEGLADRAAQRAAVLGNPERFVARVASGPPDVAAAPAADATVAAPRRGDGRWIRTALIAAAAAAVAAGAVHALTRPDPARDRAASPVDELPAIPLDQLPGDAAPFDPPSAPAGEPIVDPALLAGRSAEVAIAEVDALAAARPGDRNAQFGRAMVYLAAGRDPRGLELLDDALRRYPDHAPGWSGKAYVEVRRGRWDAAEQAFARALQLDPGDGAALRNRGIMRHRLGRVRDAYSDLRVALAIDPDDVEAMSELIQLYARLDRGDDTRALLERAARLRPDRPQVWLDLSQTQTPPEALRSIRRALAIDPASARGRQRLCDVLTSMHDPGAATACDATATPSP